MLHLLQWCYVHFFLQNSQTLEVGFHVHATYFLFKFIPEAPSVGPSHCEHRSDPELFLPNPPGV